jgi:lysine 2,3-aminomutase
MTRRVEPAALKSAQALVDAGLVAPARKAEVEAVAARYAIAIPPALASLINKSDPADPIARQFVPDGSELAAYPGEDPDPIGDALKSPVKGVVHRYPDRVLLKLVSICAVYCRFCFRRETIGPGERMLDAAEFAAALAYIRADKNIWEVVLTGGDPLVLSARRIAEATRALAAIPHVKILRWHTRMPVAAPERVTSAMARALTSGHGKTIYVALHANHARELTPQARAACKRLIDAGVAMVSQTVLLKGVNDNIEALEALMRGLVEARVKPYYLHHGDLAPGTAHFRTTIAAGQELVRQLRQRVSGLAQPSYVLDIPGAFGKAPVSPSSIRARGAKDWEVVDASGATHAYTDRCVENGKNAVARASARDEPCP